MLSWFMGELFCFVGAVAAFGIWLFVARQLDRIDNLERRQEDLGRELRGLEQRIEPMLAQVQSDVGALQSKAGKTDYQRP